MKGRKLISILLSLILVLGLAACNSSENDPSQEDSSQASSVGESTSEPVEDEASSDEASSAEEGSEVEREEVSVKAGTYTGNAQGHNGPVSVEVTVDEEGTIQEIAVVETSETLTIGSGAFEIVKDHILEQQDLAVEKVSGATVSRAAYISAITDALDQAGVDTAALKESGEPVESTPLGDLETEVLVIGGGVAGFTAAIEARSQGAEVILIEKQGIIGGTTARSEGIIQAAETELQQENGVEDSVEQFYTDFTGLQTDPDLDDELIRLGIENSPDMIKWFNEVGVEFTELEAAHTLPPRDIMRGHYAENKGGGMMQQLNKHAEEIGVEIYTNTKAVEIIMEDGRAVGAKAVYQDGEEITITSQATVIATGGYTNNPELMAELHPEIVDYTTYNSNTGDGYILAKEAGAEMINKPPALVHYSNRLPGAKGAVNTVGFYTPTVVLITEDGLRYASEEAYTFDRSGAVIDKGSKEVFAVLSNDFVEENKEGVQTAVEEGKIISSNSLDDIAQEYGIDADNLKQTVETYNANCDNGLDEDFGKNPEFLKTIDGPDYYIMKLYPSVAESYNGPRITVNGEVISTNGEPIPGLYAAGGVTMAQFTDYHYYSSGTAILFSSTVARSAANHIIENIINK